MPLSQGGFRKYQRLKIKRRSMWIWNCDVRLGLCHFKKAMVITLTIQMSSFTIIRLTYILTIGRAYL